MSTNPLFVTNREAALSATGIEQIEETVQILKANDINPSIIRYAIAASSTDTGNIVARELKVGRDKMVPEFNYLEPRAIGIWDMLSLNTTEKAVWAMDATEAGNTGLGGRPPPNEDGTPHERLADVSIRLRQLISVLETQYSGDCVLVVACDGTTLALLQCMMAGIPFDHVHELEYKPGEVRLDVTMQSTLALWKERQASAGFLKNYNKIIDEGTIELQRLREMKDIVSLKDQRLEEEQREMEAVFQTEQAEKRRVAAEEQAARQERAQRLAAEPSSVSPLAIVGGSAGMFGAAIAVNFGTEAAEVAVVVPQETKLDEEAVVSPMEEPPIQDTYIPAPREDRIFDPNLDSGDKSLRPLPWIAEPSAVAEAEVNGNTTPKIEQPLLPTVNKAEAAEQAMEDYMNQDDGGDDWLQNMAAMIGDDDDDE